MNFNSPEFLLFFPLVLFINAFVTKTERSRDVFLLLCSYAFYMCWNWMYAGLILFSTALDFFLGRSMASTENDNARRVLLWASVVMNLSVLAIFKYYNFFLDVTAETAGLLGMSFSPDNHYLRVLLPVGVSFYTFQSLSYTIDVYRRNIKAETSFVKFALFVAFFPQLVAGPIVRAADFLPQLWTNVRARAEDITSGLVLVFRGLVKKILIADLLAGLGVDAVFADPGSFSSLALLLAIYGYSFQIYNDFSGYSDIAIGTARMLGFHFPENFNRPYLAQNVRDFWTRWHISLSSWLRDYLYIPLGGSRGSPWRVRFNLMATMLLGGLWHGASMNFVLWGAWHGLLLIAAHGASKSPTEPSVSRVWLRRFVTFHLVAISWLLFRIQDVPTLFAYVGSLLTNKDGIELSAAFGFVLAVAAVIHFSPPSAVNRLMAGFARLPTLIQASAYAGTVLVFVALSLGTGSFIYFQF